MTKKEFWQGDCLELMRGIPDGSVDMICTDIPYGVVNRSSQGLRNFDKSNADVETFSLQDFVTESIRVCSGSFYVFCSTEQVSELRRLFDDHGCMTRLGIWEKTNPSPMNGQYSWLSGVETCVFARKKGATFNEHCKNTVWRFPITRSKIHPTQKPVALFEYIIGASTNPGDTVLDNCAGSGTTAIAALNTGRGYICIEKDPEYYRLATERISNHADTLKERLL